MFDKLMSKLGGGHSMAMANYAAPPGQAPSRKAIYQSRQNFGVNFGSVFVMEKYIYGKLFVDGASCEIEAATNCMRKSGADGARKQFEDHWNGYCSDDDWRWLQSKGVQSIRLPIGYWDVNGGQFTKGTPFEKVAAVYKNAWSIIVEKYIKKAAEYHISVLIDLHALPKAANTGDHSGIKCSQPGFWGDSRSVSLAIDAVGWLARELSQFENISGLQIVNEAVFDNQGRNQMAYYAGAINEIRKYNGDIPIVISDGWWADQWVKWINEHGGASLGVVIDDHVYRCFSNEDKAKSADQITNDLNSSVLTGLSGPADFLIGEYSCVLDGQTWDRSKGQNRDDAVKRYGRREVELFKQRADTGYYFWTFKFEYGDGGEWGFRPMVDRGAIPARKTSPNKLPDQNDFNNIFNQEFQGHQSYWNQANPREKYEHWRYQEGFTTAWADCMEFAKFDNSRIGRICAWTEARRQQHIGARGQSRFLWEWSQGFQKAIERFAQFQN